MRGENWPMIVVRPLKKIALVWSSLSKICCKKTNDFVATSLNISDSTNDDKGNLVFGSAANIFSKVAATTLVLIIYYNFCLTLHGKWHLIVLHWKHWSHFLTVRANVTTSVQQRHMSIVTFVDQTAQWEYITATVCDLSISHFRGYRMQSQYFTRMLSGASRTGIVQVRSNRICLCYIKIICHSNNIAAHDRWEVKST